MNGRQRWATAALCALLSLGLAMTYVAWQEGFGAGDLTAMLIWSVPLGVLLSRLFAVVRRWLPGRTLTRRALILALTGVVAALGWTMGLAMLLGGWLLAFSFPVGPIWIIASAVSGVFAASVSAGTAENGHSRPS